MFKRILAAVIVTALIVGTLYAGDFPPFQGGRNGDGPYYGHPMNHGGWGGPGQGRGPQMRGGPGMRGPGSQMRGGPGMRGHGPQMRGGMNGGMAFMAQELGLSDEQKTKINDIMTSNFNEANELRQTLADSNRSLWELRRNPSTSSEALADARKKVSEARDKLDAKRDESRAKMLEQLTPEQIKKFETLSAGNTSMWRGRNW